MHITGKKKSALFACSFGRSAAWFNFTKLELEQLSDSSCTAGFQWSVQKFHWFVTSVIRRSSYFSLFSGFKEPKWTGRICSYYPFQAVLAFILSSPTHALIALPLTHQCGAVSGTERSTSKRFYSSQLAANAGIMGRNRERLGEAKRQNEWPSHLERLWRIEQKLPFSHTL